MGPDPRSLQAGSGPGTLSAGPHCSAKRREGTTPLRPEKRCPLTQLSTATLDSQWQDRRQDTEGDSVRKEMQGAGETRRQGLCLLSQSQRRNNQTSGGDQEVLGKWKVQTGPKPVGDTFRKPLHSMSRGRACQLQGLD